MRFKYIIIILFLHFPSWLHSQVEFSASAPRAVEVGEQFRLTYTVNEKSSTPEIPSVDGLQFLGGPQTSTSSSFQVINGKVTQSYNITYSYYFRATKEGTFTIPPATVKVGNKKYTSNEISIQVVKGSAPPPTSPQGKTNPSDQPGQQNNKGTSDNNLFLRVHVNKTNVYQGEHIIATVKIYSKLNLSGLESLEIPNFGGFYQQEIETPQLRTLEREVINGEVYGTGVLNRYILYPQRSGKLTIEPAKIVAQYQQRVSSRPRSVFDEFFGQQYRTISKQLTSNQVNINVKPLPPSKPTSFTGAVGKFSMNASIDKTELKTNDAVTIKVNVQGNGNLKLLQAPKLDFPPDFEVYDPKITSNLNNSLAGQSGSIVYEYLAIPRHSGNFRIAPVEFSYFDVKSGSFKTLRSNEFKLSVTKGDESQSGTVISGLSKEDIKFIGSDIKFIKTNISLKKVDHLFFGSIYFYLSYLIVLILFTLIIYLRRTRIKRNANTALVKNRKANKQARKRLKMAQAHLKKTEKDQFFEELSRALYGYLSDKLGIPQADLSHDTIHENLRRHNIEEELTKEYIRLIDDSDFARYAPPSEAVSESELYGKAVKLITKLDQKLR